MMNDTYNIYPKPKEVRFCAEGFVFTRVKIYTDSTFSIAARQILKNIHTLYNLSLTIYEGTLLFLF